jgi:hypothetical protein
MWNGCSEMRERDRTERREILKKDGRIRWMKEIWNMRERIGKNVNFLSKVIKIACYSCQILKLFLIIVFLITVVL